MGAACSDCGGVGYGRVEPGGDWVPSAPPGADPIPCPSCVASLEARAKKGGGELRRTNESGVKRIRPGDLTLGPYVRPAQAEKRRAITVVDGGTPSNEEGTDAIGAGFSEEQIRRSVQ